MKTIKIALCIGVLAGMIGCGGDNEPAQCSADPVDAASGWSCRGVFQLGLWACTCNGPSPAPATSVTDALSAEAKACMTMPTAHQ